MSYMYDDKTHDDDDDDDYDDDDDDDDGNEDDDDYDDCTVHTNWCTIDITFIYNNNTGLVGRSYSPS